MDLDTPPFILFTTNTRPTFIFLKGSTKVDQVKGANQPYVPLIYLMPSLISYSELESAVRRHSSGSSSSSAFSGRGHTLGDSQPPIDISRAASDTLNKVAAPLTKLDSQTRVLLGLVAAYAVFWYISR